MFKGFLFIFSDDSEVCLSLNTNINDLAFSTLAIV